MERLEAAVQYGADAVYLAAKSFGMRTSPGNFDDEQLHSAVAFCHAAGVRVYLACNILPHDTDMERLPAAMEVWQDAGIDALIMADIGVMEMAKRHAPRCDMHISTQTGVVNAHTARVLHDMGAARVVLARELSLDEIAELRTKIPAELELECFVHGAMCMGFSGRCMLSAYLTGRDANQGDCTQPCRWKYGLTEQNRPGYVYTVEEYEDGTYLFNANDLNMLKYTASLAYAGVSSFKIEGRAKAAYYTAVTANAYRCAAEAFESAGFSRDWVPEPWMEMELNKISHRPYGTGFYFEQPAQNTKEGGYIREYKVAAVVEGYENGRLMLSQRNRFFSGDMMDVLSPGKPPVMLCAADLRDESGETVDAAPHPMMRVSVACDVQIEKGSILRTKM